MKKQMLSLMALSMVILTGSATAADIIKANNTTALVTGGSFTTNPILNDGTEVAVWDNTVAGANTVALGGNLNLSGLRIASPGGAVIVTQAAGNVLTLGSAGIDMSAATQNLTLLNTANVACNIAIGASQTWNVASGRTLQLWSNSNSQNQRLTGSGNIEITGGGIVRVLTGDAGSTTFTAGNGNDTYSGNWTITNGSVRGLRNGTHAWGTGVIYMNGGTLGQEQGGWTWSNNIVLNASTTSTFDDFNGSGTTRYLKLQGVISGSGNLNIIDTNNRMDANSGFILTGANTMSGTITVGASGNLRVGGVTGNDTTTGAGTGGTLGTASVNLNAATATLTFSRSDAHTVANAISGTGVVNVGGTVTGAGSQVLTLSGTSTYTGATTVAQGRLNLTGSLTSAITVASGAKISGTGSTTGLLTLSSGGGLVLAGGATTTSLTVNGATFGGSNVLTFLTNPTASTVYDVYTYGTGTVTNPGNLIAPYRGTLADDTVNQKYTFTAGEYGANRTWNTTTGAWDVGVTANWVEGDQKFYGGDNVIFGDIASDSTVTLTGTLLPGSVTVGNSANKYTFQTGAISGEASLAKNNAGTLEIASVQTYTGGTTVAGGTLRISGSSGSGTGMIRGTLSAGTGTTIEIGGADVLGYSTGADAVRTINLDGATLVQTQDRNETNTAVVNMAGGSTISATGGANALFDMFGGTAAINSTGDATNTISSPIRLRQNNTTFTVADGAAATDLLISGIISRAAAEGNGVLVKAGAGVLALNNANTYDGGTTISAGTLLADHAAALGTANVTVNGTGVLKLNTALGIRGLTNAAGETAAIVDLNGQTLTIGTTTVNSTAFYYGGLTGTGTMALRGGGATIANADGTVGASTNFEIFIMNTAQIGAASPFALDTGASNSDRKDFGFVNDTGDTLTLSSLTGYGAIRVDSGGTAGTTVTRHITVDQSGGDTTFHGALLSHRSSANAVRELTLEKKGTSALTLAGFIGKETASSGAGAAPVNLIVNGGILDVTNAANTTTTNTDAIRLGTVTITSGTLGFASQALVNTAGTAGATVILMNGGTLRWDTGNTQDLTAGGRLTLVDGKTAMFDTNGQDVSFANTLGLGGSGTGGLTKTGGGTLTMAAADFYSGATGVTGGTLSVTGSLNGDGAVTVAAGGTLAGTGSINGATTVDGTLSPGTGTPGTLAINNDLTLNGTAALAWTWANPALASVNVTGALVLDGTLTVAGLATMPAGTYTLITYTGGLTDNGLAITDPGDGRTYSIDKATAGQVNLVISAVLTPYAQWWKDNYSIEPPPPEGGDYDGDGTPNGDEFAAKTNPTDNTSYLHLTNVAPAGNDMTVSVFTGGATYDLERTSDLLGSWTDIGDITGNDAIQDVTDPGAATGATWFYRVKVQ